MMRVFVCFFYIFNFYDYYFIIDTLDTSSHNAMRSKFALCGVCLFFSFSVTDNNLWNAYVHKKWSPTRHGFEIFVGRQQKTTLFSESQSIRSRTQTHTQTTQISREIPSLFYHPHPCSGSLCTQKCMKSNQFRLLWLPLLDFVLQKQSTPPQRFRLHFNHFPTIARHPNPSCVSWMKHCLTHFNWLHS